jgi:predicted XRE-type DNA-binding protein
MNQDDRTSSDRVIEGTDNVFADLGVPDAQTHKLKAELVVKLRDVITDLKLTQAQAGERLGVTQPEVSRILNGRFREVSVERLMRMLTRLGCEVDIVVKAAGHDAAYAPIQLEPAPQVSLSPFAGRGGPAAEPSGR